MIARCVAKVFGLGSSVTPIEFGVIFALLSTALLSSLFAVGGRLADMYSSLSIVLSAAH